jgi:nickel-dependent lactate racemase
MRKETIQLAYGRGEVQFEVPESNLLGVFYPKDLVDILEEDKHIQAALAHPIGTPPLREMVRPGGKVAIVTSDLTRPCPSDRMLPYIITELGAAGIPEEDIFIVIALGLHRPMIEEEIDLALSPKIHSRIRTLNHDSNDTVHLGTTSTGTPVEIFRPLVEADFRICLGNLEFHYFAGYSGGAKAVFPGCASRAGVTANHAMMVRPEAAAGRISGNPLRCDLEEAVDMLGVDFIFNVLVDGQKNILAAVAGDVTEAHRAGSAIVAERGMVEIPKLADIVIASPGGYPKDINFYQSHKALENAKYALRDGGIIILVAECSEGVGNQTFESWMFAGTSPEELIHRIQREFVLGGHKAAAIAAIQTRCKIYLVSGMPPEFVRQGNITPFSTVKEALDAAFHQLGEDSEVIILPQAVSVLPHVT